MNTESYSYEQALKEERDFWRDVAHIIKEDVVCLSCHLGEGHRGPEGEKYECPLDLVPDARKECAECPDLGMYEPCCLTAAAPDKAALESDLKETAIDRASALYELTQIGWSDSSTIMFGNKRALENRDKAF
jgi:hypothetical protein